MCSPHHSYLKPKYKYGHTSLLTSKSGFHSALAAAKSECSRVSSDCPFFMSSCSLPAFEKKRSTPAELAGRPRNCLAILARCGRPSGQPVAALAGRAWSRAFHQSSTFRSRFDSAGRAKYFLRSSAIWTSSSESSSKAFLSSKVQAHSVRLSCCGGRVRQGPALRVSSLGARYYPRRPHTGCVWFRVRGHNHGPLSQWSALCWLIFCTSFNNMQVLRMQVIIIFCTSTPFLIFVTSTDSTRVSSRVLKTVAVLVLMCCFVLYGILKVKYWDLGEIYILHLKREEDVWLLLF